MKLWNRPEGGKVPWGGKIISMQPRIRLTRSFDQRSHTYLGFTLAIEGVVGGDERTFTVGIGKEAQAKHQFKAGDVVSGKSEEVRDPRSEVSEYYKTSELRVLEKGTVQEVSGPPWQGVPPVLEVYRNVTKTEPKNPRGLFLKRSLLPVPPER